MGIEAKVYVSLQAFNDHVQDISLLNILATIVAQARSMRARGDRAVHNAHGRAREWRGRAQMLSIHINEVLTAARPYRTSEDLALFTQ